MSPPINPLLSAWSLATRRWEHAAEHHRPRIAASLDRLHPEVCALADRLGLEHSVNPAEVWRLEQRIKAEIMADMERAMANPKPLDGPHPILTKAIERAVAAVTIGEIHIVGTTDA